MAVLRRVQARDRPVVRQPVVPTHDAKTDDVSLVVKDLEPLRAADSWQPGYDVDFPQRPHLAVTKDDVAALDEVLVGLWVVEPAHDRPHGGYGGCDVLGHGGAALVGAHRVGVVAGDAFRDVGGREVAVGVVLEGGRGCGVDPLE